MIILPHVAFSSQEHPMVRFSMKLRLWSKPTKDDAEMTASLVCALGWVALFIIALIATRSLGWMLVILGAADLLGRTMGMRSSWCFIPLWVLALVGTLVVTSFEKFG